MEIVGFINLLLALFFSGLFVAAFLWVIWPVFGPLYWFVREDLFPELWVIAYTSRLGSRIRRSWQLSILSYRLLSLFFWTWWCEWSWQSVCQRHMARWRVK